jgi:hypothetical protein
MSSRGRVSSSSRSLPSGSSSSRDAWPETMKLPPGRTPRWRPDPRARALRQSFPSVRSCDGEYAWSASTDTSNRNAVQGCKRRARRRRVSRQGAEIPRRGPFGIVRKRSFTALDDIPGLRRTASVTRAEREQTSCHDSVTAGSGSTGRLGASDRRESRRTGARDTSTPDKARRTGADAVLGEGILEGFRLRRRAVGRAGPLGSGLGTTSTGGDRPCPLGPVRLCHAELSLPAHLRECGIPQPRRCIGICHRTISMGLWQP